ncbi:MAG TPA: hypothetical protein VGN39_10935, partial [Terriglobales bacterium]|nr:hypothetical protein [Terriglobales bacterium]
AVKDPAEVWILGLAAEAVGAASARREVTILSTWDRPNAVHPLAVHFCSSDCKEDYLARLFGPEADAAATIAKRARPLEIAVEGVASRAKKKEVHSRHRRKKSA